jgi:hypothetical protein
MSLFVAVLCVLCVSVVKNPFSIAVLHRSSFIVPLWSLPASEYHWPHEPDSRRREHRLPTLPPFAVGRRPPSIPRSSK